MATGPDGAPEPATGVVPGPGLDAALLDGEVDRAVAIFLAGQAATAARLLRVVRREAERLGDDRSALVVVARSCISEAAPHFDVSGDMDGALALLDRADAIAHEIGAVDLLARSAGQRALVVLRSGDTRAAFGAFDRAVALIDGAAPRDRALIMLNRGVLHLEQADLERAGADLARAAQYADAADEPRVAAMARHNLGYIDFLAGRLPRALATYEEAARTIPGGPHPAMQLDHARALREAGLVRFADELLAQAGSRVRESRLFQDLGETELVRADCALSAEEPKLARAFATSARRRFERRGNLRWQRKAELMVLRSERAALADRAVGGRRTALLALAQRADELAASCRRERRADLARWAEVLASECRLAAGEAAGGATTRLRATDPLPVRLQVREVRALAARLDRDDSRALAEVRRGLAELGSFQRSLGSLDLRTAGAVHGVALARLGLDITVARDRPGDVLAMVERSRAISTRLPRVRPPDDARTASLLTALRRVEEDARVLEGDPDSAVALARLRGRASSLQRDIRARAWELEGDEEADGVEAPHLSHIRSAVRDTGSAFVSYARHQDRWLAVLVRRSRAALVPLASTTEVAESVRRVRADLDALAMPHLPGPIADSVRGSLRSGLARLDDLLLSGLGLAGESVVLSCSGPLSVLPWSLLPSRVGRPTVVTPSAGTWLRGRTIARPVGPRVVALAGPGLHESEKEARAVATTWPGAELLAGEAATTAAARDALARSDVLHVAAHGTHRHDSPLFSSLRLVDGPLYAYELDPAQGMPGCVTLSACEAGLATLRPGDEGLGLTHVLLHDGVGSVVAGVARVRDDVAAVTMQRVHEEMAGGTSSAEALAVALAEAQDAPAPAPFVTFGSAW
ncbi:MAG TPA: CHAT domain-containing protein [Nocardioides sp.]|uniref:CHAT domain-containing protein n=1 Tax=Nocardioides sp. TaxID=35761 RepID=UPI002D7F2A58|nr:CHAT domain-containing protein [Nocardioides sp.]HET6652447.1 CHAT domain-containing protein [Nocardioides sp.]